MYGEDLTLPERGVLLHVGPFKTGTTAIQGALKLATPAMAELGITYTGNVRQHKAALAVTGRGGLIGDIPAEPRHWNRLVGAVAAAGDNRVVVSSEFFCDADLDDIHTVVDGLGGDRVHILITLRPLAKILPSAWQQYVRNGVRGGYQPWLRNVLNDGPVGTRSFWFRHHHDRLVERWASVVGPERVLVLVVDETKPDAILRSFEQILELPDGLLKLDRRTNRSLTGAETQLVRALNVKFVDGNWPKEVYSRCIRWGVVEQMQQREPAADEPGITTPAWAVERANEIAATAAARIAAMGVRVEGDLASLSQVVPREGQVAISKVTLPPAAAAEAVTGVIVTSGVLDVVAEVPVKTVRPIESYTSGALVRVVARRVARRLRATIGLRPRR